MSFRAFRGLCADFLHSLSKVQDLSPLRGCPLEVVNLINCKIVNLTPLRGAPLREAYITFTQSGDLSFLADAPIEKLDCSNGLVFDLTPLRGKPLASLFAYGNPISDLRPLAGLPLLELDLNNSCSKVTDFSPLLELPRLEKLRLGPAASMKASIEPLRKHPSPKYIGMGVTPYRPVAEFWAEYDAQQAAGKK